MKPQHQIFIIKMIKYGDKVQAYRAAYPKCTSDETARKSAERILRHHPEVAAEIEEATAYMRQRTYAEAYRDHVERQKTPLLSMMKRREILAQIATCQMKVGRFVKDGDRYKMLFEDPRPRDIMRAIETDAKMEDACNRMRNCNDPFFSQFYIYIDGRPCDQPHLPPDPNLPPGIYMLPRRRKNQIEKSGIISEQNLLKDSFPACPDSFGSTLSPAACPDSFGSGGVSSADGGGTLEQEKSLIEEPGIISEQNNHTSPHPGDLGVTLAQNQNSGIILEQTSLSPAGGGVSSADGGGALAQEKILIEELGIKTEQIHLSPAGGGVSSADWGGALEQEKILIEEPGIKTPTRLSHSDGEQNNHTSPHPGDLGVPLAPDPLAASFYKQEQQARASAPPPHILTPEEVKELDEEYARKRRNDKPVKPSTFGKMYFKEKGINYDNIE